MDEGMVCQYLILKISKNFFCEVFVFNYDKLCPYSL